MNIRIFKLWPLFCLLATGCYEEEHFSFPGPFDVEELVTDTLPNPFGGAIPTDTG